MTNTEPVQRARRRLPSRFEGVADDELKKVKKGNLIP